MNGVICIIKPQDFTSFDVIAKMRGMTGVRKMGHAGTLDPMATGVLPLLLGTATKACDILPNEEKRYTAGFRFGVETDTQDSTGTVLSTSDIPVARQALESALKAFEGEIDQLPPMYSAVRVNGQRLYDLARQGRNVEREPRRICIKQLTILEYDESTREGEMDIRCSKGTYVRTILHDVGEVLGAGGIMTSLVRTESSGFTLDDCITMEQAQRLADCHGFEEVLIPPERLFANCPRIRLSKPQERMFLNGVRLDLNRLRYQKQDNLLHAVYSADGVFLGVAKTALEPMELRVTAFF